MKLDKTKISPGGTGGSNSSATISMQQINNLLKTSKNNSPSSQNEFNTSSVHRSPSIREVCFSIIFVWFFIWDIYLIMCFYFKGTIPE